MSAYNAKWPRLTEFRFDPPEVPGRWTPDPTRVWDSTQEGGASNRPGSDPVSSHQQWKTGISADEVRAYIAMWFNLMDSFIYKSEALFLGSSSYLQLSAQFGITFPQRTGNVCRGSKIIQVVQSYRQLDRPRYK
jgi:hypothetical protein